MRIDNRRLINPNARKLWNGLISPRDRLLVTGASGWFGKTVFELMRNNPAQILAIGSYSRKEIVAGRSMDVLKYDETQVKDFSPTILIDCAFLTKEASSKVSITEFTKINRTLISQMASVLVMPTIRAAVTISSGAAIYPFDAHLGSLVDNPYGYLKRESEEEFKKTIKLSDAGGTIARAWSVSGAFVTNPNTYAFSNLILQSLAGNVSINSDSKVFRRYSSVEDIIALSLAEAVSGGIHELDSGGPLLEIQELAEAIVSVINPDAVIQRPELKNSPAHNYHSDSQTWDTLLSRYALNPSTLVDQIINTRNGITAQSGHDPK